MSTSKQEALQIGRELAGFNANEDDLNTGKTFEDPLKAHEMNRDLDMKGFRILNNGVLMNGVPGPTGPQGEQGEQGATGAQGPQGAPGNDGVGLPGPQGPAGPAGPQGDPGAQGPAGPAGADGQDGVDGAPGPQGATGATGATGAQGEAGTPGSQGVQGPTGPAGPEGPEGPTGPQGAPGATGPAGADGLPGAKGDPGDIGPTTFDSRFIDTDPGPQTIDMSTLPGELECLVVRNTGDSGSNVITITGMDTADETVAYSDGVVAFSRVDADTWERSAFGSSSSGGAAAWDYYALNWSSTPTLHTALPSGDVWEYTLDSTTRYRLVPATYDPAQDAFYSSFDGTDLTGLIAARG